MVKVKLDRAQVRRGDSVRIQVSASDTTRTIVARMYGTAPVYLRWSSGTELEHGRDDGAGLARGGAIQGDCDG